MAYCDKCGAYIPDGQEKCLACGYDPGAAAREESRAAAAARYRQQEQAEEARRREEEERRRAEQASAEEERRKRVDEDRRWAEKEYARRRAERIRNEGSRWENADFGSVREDAGLRRGFGENKVLGILSYFSFLFILPYIFAPNDKFSRFHARQGLSLFIFSAIADALSATPFGWIMQVMRIYMMVKGVISAANGRCEPLPFIGKYIGK